MKKEISDTYYNRTISDKLFEFIKVNYQWLIDFVFETPELDFQTGSNATDTWFSIYRGTGKILKIKENGKCSADPKYIKLLPSFYESPSKEELKVLLNLINKDNDLGRYYKGIDGKKKEGFYQNLISKRYSLFCEPDDDFCIIDKEFALGYKDEKTKRELMEPIIKKYDSFIKKLEGKQGFGKKIKQSGTECDFVGLKKDGDILLLELKRHEDTAKIYLSPLQAGKYTDLTMQYVNKHPDIFSSNILKMVRQKIEMGILKPKFQLPNRLSKRIIPAVVVGGKPSVTTQHPPV